jgi:hypothetical protein
MAVGVDPQYGAGSRVVLTQRYIVGGNGWMRDGAETLWKERWRRPHPGYRSDLLIHKSSVVVLKSVQRTCKSCGSILSLSNKGYSIAILYCSLQFCSSKELSINKHSQKPPIHNHSKMVVPR